MTIIAKSDFLEFKSAKSPSDEDWFYAKRTNDSKEHDTAVVITTLVKNDNGYSFLFLKTKRPPLYAENKADYCLESPAGLIGDENNCETLDECIKKELLEETGLKYDKIFIELKNSATSSGLSSETITYATAIINKPIEIAPPLSDGGIIVQRMYVKTDDVESFFQKCEKENISVAAATVCGVFFAVRRIAKL